MSCPKAYRFTSSLNRSKTKTVRKLTPNFFTNHRTFSCGTELITSTSLNVIGMASLVTAVNMFKICESGLTVICS
eukprot:06191.XXX_212979_213203_1 [CDS] Oithona nana genome sequencing.